MKTRVADKPGNLLARNVLQAAIDGFFGGNLSTAAKGFGMHLTSLRRMLYGEEPVSRPMLARMQRLTEPGHLRQERIAFEQDQSKREFLAAQMRESLAIILANPPTRRSYRSVIAGADSLIAESVRKAKRRAAHAAERAALDRRRTKENDPPERAA